MAFFSVSKFQFFIEFLPRAEWARGVEFRPAGADSEFWVLGIHAVVSVVGPTQKADYGKQQSPEGNHR